MRHHPRKQAPSAADLAAIDGEWPAIEADLAVLDAEIWLATVARPSSLDWRRLRRAEHQALIVRMSLYRNEHAAPSTPEVA